MSRSASGNDPSVGHDPVFGVYRALFLHCRFESVIAGHLLALNVRQMAQHYARRGADCGYATAILIVFHHEIHQHPVVRQIGRPWNASREHHEVLVGGAVKLHRVEEFVEIQFCHDVDLVRAPDGAVVID